MPRPNSPVTCTLWKSAALVVAIVVVGIAQPSPAQTLATLHSFKNAGIDGSGPLGTLVIDKTGNLYGTTISGGARVADCVFDIYGGGCGVVFRLTPDGHLTVLHSFEGGSDGTNPGAGLVMDEAGNLYGTTEGGKPKTKYESNVATVFAITTDNAEMVLHDFSPNDSAQGEFPVSSLVIGTDGNIYGTTELGGRPCADSLYGCGTVFQITPSGDESVLYTFTGGKDGASPKAGLLLDTKGDLYGTTALGGTFGLGTVFELTPSGNGWSKTIIQNFGGVLGSGPQGNLVFDPNGNIYGTTVYGGTYTWGCVFMLQSSPNGWKEKVIYSFTGGADGKYPYAGLVFDNKGHLYSTTQAGGTYGEGTVFELIRTSSGWSETVLHSFNGNSQPEGAEPYSGVVFDSQGNLYGTTSAGGGVEGSGTVFKLTLN